MDRESSAGDFVFDGAPTLIKTTRQRWPFLAEDHARRLVGAYGTLVDSIVPGGATRIEDLRARFGADLTGAELRYLMHKEWAQTADDVLWRRSKLGLRFSAAERVALDGFMVQAAD